MKMKKLKKRDKPVHHPDDFLTAKDFKKRFGF
jgi:hypothetical protein